MEAETLLAQMLASVDALANDIVAASGSRTATNLQPVFSRVQAVRAALIVDASAQIGSLPSVVEVPVAATRSLWSLCYGLAGDDVSSVQSGRGADGWAG